MTVKSAAKSVGNGILTGLSAVHNASIQSQINEIDDEIEPLEKQLKDLKERRAALEARKTYA